MKNPLLSGMVAGLLLLMATSSLAPFAEAVNEREAPAWVGVAAVVLLLFYGGLGVSWPRLAKKSPKNANPYEVLTLQWAMATGVFLIGSIAWVIGVPQAIMSLGVLMCLGLMIHSLRVTGRAVESLAADSVGRAR